AGTPAGDARTAAVGGAAGGRPARAAGLRTPSIGTGGGRRRCDGDRGGRLARWRALAGHGVLAAARGGHRAARVGTVAAPARLRARGPGHVRARRGRRGGTREGCPALPRARPDRPGADRYRAAVPARRGAVRGAAGDVVELRRPYPRGDRGRAGGLDGGTALRYRLR